MKLTKYEHACFTLETAGEVLVVDPGSFTDDFVVTDNIAAIVVTHEHADHFDPDKLAAIYAKNPNAVFVSLPAIVDKLPGHKSHAVRPGDKVDIGPFRLRFFGGKHALIHVSLPLIDNLGVLINDTVYYPGDSFTLPNTPVDVLALPVGAPWLKLSETNGLPGGHQAAAGLPDARCRPVRHRQSAAGQPVASHRRKSWGRI